MLHTKKENLNISFVYLGWNKNYRCHTNGKRIENVAAMFVAIHATITTITEFGIWNTGISWSRNKASLKYQFVIL